MKRKNSQRLVGIKPMTSLSQGMCYIAAAALLEKKL